MLRNSFFKTIPFLFFIFIFNSCDKEFSVVGEDIIGNPSFGITKEKFPVVAYNQKLGPIQSNDMPINALGVYDNPSFGKTKASFVTQVALESLNNSFDATAKIKSAVLTIPYYSHKDPDVPVGTDGKTVYILDNIYGPSLAKMKLSVYESGYFMRDLDPEDQFTQAQKYYTNQYSEFYTAKEGKRLNNSSDEAQNDLFFFDPDEIEVKTTLNKVETVTRSAPAMKLSLNTTFFQNKILKAPKEVLSSNTLFKDYFRGLFFDIQNIGSTPGNLAMINFKGGKITVTYTETIDKKEVEKSMVILLNGHTNNFLEEITKNSDYDNATNEDNIDEVKGDPNLYLKGGQGSLSVVKLFGEDKFGEDGVSGVPNEVPDRLDIMRYNKYLVNQAEITFHLNSSAMGASYIPKRIYLYDYTNYKVLEDYRLDVSSTADPKNNKYIFGGILTKLSDANGGEYIYKFRITSHIQNLVKDSKSKNVDLGLVVTEDISSSNVFYALRDNTKIPLYAPMASVMNPLGAIIFGNNAADEKNKIKFEIYYTKAN